MAKDPVSTPTTISTAENSTPEKEFKPPEPLPPTEQKNDYKESDSEESATNSSDESDGEPAAPEPTFSATRGRWLWLAFLKLAKPVRVLLVGLLGSAFFITPFLVVYLRFRSHPVKFQVHVWSLWLTITWVASCATYMVVDLIPRLVVYVTRLFGGKIERLKIQVELTMAVKSWLKLALDISWAWISLSIIRAVYQPSQDYWVILNRMMQALFASGIILFVEKLFLQFVAINFHEKALAERIAENHLGLKALDRLSNAQIIPTKKTAKREGKPTAPPHLNLSQNGGEPEKGDITLTENLALKDDNNIKKAGVFTPPASSQPERRRRKNMTSIIVDQVGGAIGQVALKDSKFHKEVDISGVHSARKLARKLFSVLNASDPPRSHLVEEDFYPFFRSTVEAHEAFALFDKDQNGDITKREMREAVQRIYRERKALISSLKDVDSIVSKLDAVLICVSIVIIIFICLLIFNRGNTISSLVPLATIILGFSFIFGHSAQTLFDSLIFIFSTHVFDIGDLVLIDDQVLFVKELGLFATTFRRVDGQEVIAPNSLLASTKLVHNLRRSKSMWETTNLVVSYDTPMEVIERLKGKVQSYMNTNSRDWSNFALWIDKMEFQNAIHLVIAMEHRPNWQDWGGRWTRRNAFMRHLKAILEELQIRYTMPIQPVLLPREHPTGTSPAMQHPLPGRHTLDDSMFSTSQTGGYARLRGF